MCPMGILGRIRTFVYLRKYFAMITLTSNEELKQLDEHYLW